MEHLLTKMGQRSAHEADHQRFLCGQGIVVGMTDLTIEVLAAAFFFKMHRLQGCFDFIGTWMFVVMVVSHAMAAQEGGIAKAAHHVVVFRTKVEVDTKPMRQKQHIQCHQQGADLQQMFLHDANLEKNLIIHYDKCIIIFFIFATIP
jgi:hypothetical protein